MGVPCPAGIAVKLFVWLAVGNTKLARVEWSFVEPGSSAVAGKPVAVDKIPPLRIQADQSLQACAHGHS